MHPTERVRAEARLTAHLQEQAHQRDEAHVEDGYDTVARGLTRQVGGDEEFRLFAQRLVRQASAVLRKWKIIEKDVTKLDRGEAAYRLAQPGEEIAEGETVAATLDQVRDPIVRQRQRLAERREYEEKRAAALRAVDEASTVEEAERLRAEVPPPWQTNSRWDSVSEEELATGALWALGFERANDGRPALNADQQEVVERVLRSGDPNLVASVYLEQRVVQGPSGPVTHTTVNKWDPSQGPMPSPEELRNDPGRRIVPLSAILRSRRTQIAASLLAEAGPILGREMFTAVSPIGYFGSQVEFGEDA